MSIAETIVADIKAGFTAIEGFVASESSRVIALARGTDFGTTLYNLVEAAISKQMSGPDKMKSVVQDVIGLAEEIISAGGWSGIFASAEHFAIAAAQLVYTDVMADLAKVKNG